MRLALGWIALVLVVQGSARASEPGPAPMISYRVKVVETEGVGWRESVLTKLKPVTRQGAAMIWTVPADAMAKVVDAMQTTRSGEGHVRRKSQVSAPPPPRFGGVAMKCSSLRQSGRARNSRARSHPRSSEPACTPP